MSLPQLGEFQGVWVYVVNEPRGPNAMRGNYYRKGDAVVRAFLESRGSTQRDVVRLSQRGLGKAHTAHDWLL